MDNESDPRTTGPAASRGKEGARRLCGWLEDDRDQGILQPERLARSAQGYPLVGVGTDERSIDTPALAEEHRPLGNRVARRMCQVAGHAHEQQYKRKPKCRHRVLLSAGRVAQTIRSELPGDSNHDGKVVVNTYSVRYMDVTPRTHAAFWAKILVKVKASLTCLAERASFRH